MRSRVSPDDLFSSGTSVSAAQALSGASGRLSPVHLVFSAQPAGYGYRRSSHRAKQGVDNGRVFV